MGKGLILGTKQASYNTAFFFVLSSILLAQTAYSQQPQQCRSYASWSRTPNTGLLIIWKPGDATTYFEYPGPDEPYWRSENPNKQPRLSFFQSFKLPPGPVRLEFKPQVDGNGWFSAIFSMNDPTKKIELIRSSVGSHPIIWNYTVPNPAPSRGYSLMIDGEVYGKTWGWLRAVKACTQG